MTRERIFLDTWFILALLNARDADHAEAKRLLPRIRSATTLVTTDAILLEACNGLAKYDRTGAAQFARTCYADARFDVVPVDRGLVDLALRQYEGVPDKEWGLYGLPVVRSHARARAPACRNTGPSFPPSRIFPSGGLTS